MTLSQEMQSYASYHQNPKNRRLHMFGVPIVTFSILLALSWIHVSSLFVIAVLIYYFKLHKTVALFITAFALPLLFLATWCASKGWGVSLPVFLLTFTLGWAIQLHGHKIEGKLPAFTDNWRQLLNGPLFVATELMIQFKLLPEWQFGPTGKE